MMQEMKNLRQRGACPAQTVILFFSTGEQAVVAMKTPCKF
jgi:hypothetical protein